jgi:D-sedoheptulose 7-phosphate isomerase
MEDTIKKGISEHESVIKALPLKDIEEAAKKIIETYSEGKKVIVFGNGGSAADAQHLVAELVGRFHKERRALPAIALTTNTSTLTAVANDYGYEKVFERQVSGLASKGDLVIGISTSGNSESVNLALKRAKEKECFTIGLTGRGGGILKSICDLPIIINSPTTARIQEMHLFIIHLWCEMLDNSL